MQSLWLRWPILPLPPRDAQDAGAAAAATPAPVEVHAPVLKPLAAPRTACSRCGAPLPASSGPGRPRSLCDECRGQKRNGQAGAPLSDLKERPLRIPNYEDPTVAQALEPPPLPWQTR
jgi:hypothetical protein